MRHIIDGYKFKAAPQPTPPTHWPAECLGVLGHEYHATWKCPQCGKTFYEPKEEWVGRVAYCDGGSEPIGCKVEA